MQEVDADRRIQILRGLRPEELPAPSPSIEESRARGEPRHDRKRRRLAGEDDTDRDLRLARENNEAALRSTQALAKSKQSSDAPLTDHRGHINLFPVEGSKRHAPKNEEAEAEAAKKKKEFEDQYTMRFSNAAGFKQSVGQKPWYSLMNTAGDVGETEETVSKDVWGNEDPRRKEREKMRLVSDDPMAAIQKGVSQLRQVERERRQWKEGRDRELRDLVEAEKRRHRRKREKPKDVDELEAFHLDPIDTGKDKSRSLHNGQRHHRHHRRKENHHRRNRSRSVDNTRSRPHQSDRNGDQHRPMQEKSLDHKKERYYYQIPTPPDDCS